MGRTGGRRRVWRRLEVAGTSMLPTLEPGDHLVVLGWGRIRAGDLVVLAGPAPPCPAVVKRVRWLGRDGDGRRAVWVEGDNGPASTDSRSWGLLPESQVLGRVVWRYAPPGRAGRIPPWSGGGHGLRSGPL